MTVRDKYQLIVDVWRFWLSHNDIDGSDEWWDSLFRDGEKFVAAHGNSFAATKLLAAVMLVIQEEYKRGKGIISTESEKAAGRH